jgi:hypothetical protein
MKPISQSTGFQLIHVGKCAGTTVSTELKENGFLFEKLHCVKPLPSSSAKYIVLIRDPVDRFTSAYNWRQKRLRSLETGSLSGSLGEFREKLECQLFAQYPDVYSLADSLARHEVGRFHFEALISLVGHVHQGFSWYMDDLFDQISPNQVIGAISVEDLATDMMELFGITVSRKLNVSSNDSLMLSTSSRQALESVFTREYRCLGRLGAMLKAGKGYIPNLLADIDSGHQ